MDPLEGSSSGTAPHQLTSLSDTLVPSSSSETQQQTPSSSSSSPPSSSTAVTETQRIAEAKAAVSASLSSVISPIDADLQARARDLHTNSTSIAKQQTDLQQLTKDLAAQTAKWKKELDASTRKLNELGDAQNWAELLERDLLVLEEVVRLKEGRADDGGNSASGTNKPLGGTEG